MEEAERLCDRVAIVDHGRLLALDTVDALVAAHGGEAAPLRVERTRLEDVFLRLTGRGSRD
jgi:ABC-2 type transport system ATP-binding protein